MMTTLIGAAAIMAIQVPANVETATTKADIAASVGTVWDAVRDVYAVDTRLVPGIVTKVERDGDVRKVTFANGFVVTERIIAIDDKAHRITYSAFGGKATYHMATMEVVPGGQGQSKIVWRTQFLPAELRPFIEQNMRQGLTVMKKHLEAASAVTR